MTDKEYMTRALQLAEKGRGYTSPNPMVGAVIVKEGRIIGEGFHPRYGDKHAEVCAIESASDSVAGSTVYCTMEPCVHLPGKKHNPPCTDRLIRERVRRVVIATIDPNPHVCGKGIQKLREAGIDVEIGIMGKQAAFLNEIYFKFSQIRLPFVLLKIAMSLDGRIATGSGDSRWITNEHARREVHQLRHQFDAVLVGSNTVRRDNPRLTVRYSEGRQPYRVVLSRTLDLPLQRHLFQDDYRERTILFTSTGSNPGMREVLTARGILVKEVPDHPATGVALASVLEALAGMGISSVLVEGGRAVFTSFVKERLFDKLAVFIAPLLIGEGIAALGEMETDRVSEALRLKNVTFRVIDDQIVIQGYRDLSFIKKVWEEAECLPG